MKLPPSEQRPGTSYNDTVTFNILQFSSSPFKELFHWLHFSQTCCDLKNMYHSWTAAK